MSGQPPSPRASASVQVVVRLRPLNTKEKKHGTLPVVSASTADKTVTVIKGQGSRQARSSYNFDNVFTAFSSQEEVFDATLKPIIRDVLMGFESTVFAYGQTGTGKTHTMEGDIDNLEMQGVIPRSAKAIFEALKSAEYKECNVSCSFLEIYNEELCDLLVEPGKKHTKLDIMGGKNGPFCRGLSESKVESAEHVLALMRRAQNQRQVGETSMNKQSSRSHCIFTIKIEAKRMVADGGVLEVGGKLHCVDLAGSECAKSANLEKGDESQSARERERKNINQSLLTLGRVVSMLKEQSQSKKKTNVRIPYRDSKLTRILQESLGGRCKTCLIATISPSVTAIEESMSTLNYAQAANGIVNKPVTTSFMSGSSSMAIDHKLSAGGGKNEAGAVEHWREMECRLEYMKAQVEEAQQALARKHLQQQELIEKAEQAEESRLAAETQHKVAVQQNSVLREQIEEHVAEKNALSQELSQTKTKLSETTSVLQVTQQTEAYLTHEAKQLIAALKMSIKDSTKLHAKLLKNREGEIERKEATNTFNQAILCVFEDISMQLDSFTSVQRDLGSFITDSNTAACQRLHHLREAYDQSLETLTNELHATSQLLKKQMHSEGGIGPHLESTNSSAGLLVQNGRELLDSRGQQLTSSFGSLRSHLAESGKYLNKLDTTYQEDSAAILQNLTEKLVRADSILKEMIASTLTTLEQHKEERGKSVESFRNEIMDWESFSKKQLNDVMAASEHQSSTVLRTLEMLESEKIRHDTINTQLSRQRDFLKDMDTNQFAEMAKQNQLLQSQKQSFDETHERNKEFCEQVMANVMNGVQDLLARQLSIIRDVTNQSHASFVSTNEELSKLSSDIQASSRAVQSTVSDSNHHIQSNFEKVSQNELAASSALQETSTTFGSIKESCDDHNSVVRNKSKLLGDIIVASQTTDRDILLNLEQNVRQSGESCRRIIAKETASDLAAGIQNLRESSTTATSFVNSALIDKTDNILTVCIEKPTDELLKDMKETVDNVQNKIQKGTEEILSLTSQHCSLIDTMGTDMDSSMKDIAACTQEQKREITDHENTIKKAVADHEQVILDKVETIKSSNSKCQKNVQEFTQDTIRPHEETPKVPEHTVPIFSEELSTTPSAEEILQIVKEEDDSKDSEAESNDCTMETDKENLVHRVVESSEKLKTAVLQDRSKNNVLDLNASSMRKEGTLEQPKRRATERTSSRLKKPRTKV